MHRDLKLGLALAVLLIGATTAFFFRNEAVPGGGLPQLQNPERLDAEIAGREIVPYLGEPEAEPIAKASPWMKPSFLGGGDAPVRATSATPDPIRIADDGEAGDAGPALPAAPATIEPQAESRPEEVAADAATARLHVVQPGDTLTGLAAKYLGGIGRFGEIYELNRDRLNGPNDLRVGMELRIPPGDSAAGSTSLDGEAEPHAGPSAETAVTEPPTETPAGQAESATPEPAGDAEPNPSAVKRFVPAVKAPFLPGRYRGAGVPSAEADEPGEPARE